MASAIYTLRDAMRDDIEFLVGVIIAIRQSKEPFNWNEMVREEREKFKSGAVQIIQYRGRDVGRLRVEREPGRIYVGGIQIPPFFQRLAVSSAIFADLAAESKRTGLPIELEVHIQNTQVLRLYRRLGFRICGSGEYKNSRNTGYYWKMHRLP